MKMATKKCFHFDKLVQIFGFGVIFMVVYDANTKIYSWKISFITNNKYNVTPNDQTPTRNIKC